MKKLILAAFMTATIALGAFANDANKINVSILNRFTSEFSKAENVNWTLKNKFAKATFEMNGKKTEVFYDLSGKKIGTSGSITVKELPGNSIKNLDKKYKDYKVTEVIRFEAEEETAYFISLENYKETIVLKASEEGHLSYFKKIK